ncbi:hypothetical protein [Amnibacterium endophyticum]|uniref:FlgD Ig-like domain-containing protein n=1 Tax=Amnibacterium endophyticum TaxID=2109337 RepID=A0ABW4LIT8_9MICO
MRRVSALLVAALLVLAAAPAPATAATPTRLLVQRSDPLMTDPVVLEVAAIDASGTAAAFTGTARLGSGRSSVRAAMRAAAGGVAVVPLPTASLQTGPATLRLTARTGGRTVTRTMVAFVDVPATLGLSGFGCTAVTRAGGTIRWAVDTMGGEPVRTPNSRDVPLLPYVGSSAPRYSMTGMDGLPLATSGRMVISDARGPVARVRLGKQVRRLVFGTRWNGRARGGFRPGTYTAVLTLTDPAGRIVTATQQVYAVARGGPCGP